MTRALVTQLVEALDESRGDVSQCLQEELPKAGYERYDRRIKAITEQLEKHEAAITAAREYLATEPAQTLAEALAQQGIKLRTEFEPKQRDHIEDSLGMVGDRVELIARLAKQWEELDPVDPYRADIGKAADMLEADAQQAKRVPMAGEEIEKIADGCRAGAGSVWPHAFARALEAHHKILPAQKPTDWGQP